MSGIIACLSASPAGAFNAALQDSANAGSADIEFQNDGDYQYGDGAGGAATEDWVTPSNAGIAAQYELGVNLISGTITSGTLDAWLDMATSRGYSKIGAGTAVLRIRFREKGTGIVRVDQNVSIVVS